MVQDKRLLAISQMIIKGKSLADIGTDHAYLPVYLIKNELVPRVIATDVAEGPYARAVKEVAKWGFKDRIEVRKGDGLKVLQKGEVYNVVIAGMGGETIASILEEDWAKAESFGHFVLQPMSKPDVLRNVLASRGWIILDEKVVGEKDKFFVLLSSRPGDKPYSLSPLEAELGPVILKSKEYLPFLRYYLKKYQRIVAELNKSQGEEKKDLLIKYRAKIKELKEVLHGQG
ncbi:tRNA (adenine22-N1)-methyltransferase [Thermosyntropha lipolytica DSM 11003]|uniref:tRNA (Adenine22-N1)-methyltransferase n=1 Tax=Thermosyntropha lipolytica DSM 11003 TaxID=1123382 RepID=A0A1M5NM50_9FIRM|nr:class I SAM-dependent methyltransferase [Thermosyntropha lipolytica]SHG90289.1 tRNA (adenine22-N1)-methyltransferase [Thermosyntropha lipolytica DSM 11003]